MRLDARTVFVLLHHFGSKLILVDPALLPILDETLRLLPPGQPAPRVVLVEEPMAWSREEPSELLCPVPISPGSSMILDAFTVWFCLVQHLQDFLELTNMSVLLDIVWASSSIGWS
jgi:hypothetical protein